MNNNRFELVVASDLDDKVVRSAAAAAASDDEGPLTLTVVTSGQIDPGTGAVTEVIATANVPVRVFGMFTADGCSRYIEGVVCIPDKEDVSREAESLRDFLKQFRLWTLSGGIYFAGRYYVRRAPEVCQDWLQLSNTPPWSSRPGV